MAYKKGYLRMNREGRFGGKMTAIRIVLFVALFLSMIIVITPIVTIDRFHVKGDSMLPTYASGDVIVVNKLAMGARIYTDYNFDSPSLHCIRMPGFGKLNVGDVAVFNAPFGRNNEKIEFKINFVYFKRCLGCPGDTIGVRDGMFYNSQYSDPIGDSVSQECLKQLPDSLIPSYALCAYPYSTELNWTIKQLGPVIIPKKGMTIKLDNINRSLYFHVIEYETGKHPDSLQTLTYKFKQDYYYFVGDNVIDSKDSRYFGFVPESFIVGKVFSR